MKFKIGSRELDFDLETKKISYKNKIFIPTIRTYGDMLNMYNKNTSLEEKEGLYYMYRDLSFNDNEKNIFKENKIRYDITIMLPTIIGKEYNKTYGHYHPKNDSGKKYQELYQVISGKAIYLQQNKKDIFYTITASNEAVNMEESYGHITINPNDKDILIMANLVDDTFKSTYDDYKINKGGMYYLFKKGWEKNYKYKNDLILNENTNKFHIDISIYDDFIKNPEKFNYLH